MHCDGAENIADLGDGAVNISISRCDVAARRWGDRAVNIGMIARRCRCESRGDGVVNIGDLSDGAVNIGDLSDGAVNIGISRGDVAVNRAAMAR